MMEMPIWAVVVLGVFAAPTAVLGAMVAIDALIELIDGWSERRRG